MMTPQDEEHLRLLSIFHFVLGGILALFSLFPIFHLFIGLAIVFGFWPSHGAEGPPWFIGLFFAVFAGGFIILGEVLAICMIKAGFRLREHWSYTFCQVVAGIECIFFPFGTVLGIFTLLVLGRPAIKEAFDARAQAKSPRFIPH